MPVSPWPLIGHTPSSWTNPLQMAEPGPPCYLPLPQFSTECRTARGTSRPAKELDLAPGFPTPLWRGRRGPDQALREPVFTPSSSTGCTFHSESSRGGNGGVRARGGARSGLLWGGSPRELRAWQGSQSQTTRGRRPRVRAQAVAPSQDSSPQV